MTSELKPCPFCGDKAEIERYGDRRVSTIYTCNSCGCSLETGEEWDHGSGWNTRAVSDVPELVRYDPSLKYGDLGGMVEDKVGEYVRHDQAVSVIAAKDAALKDAQAELWGCDIDLKAAEAKLAQSEKQETIGHIVVNEHGAIEHSAFNTSLGFEQGVHLLYFHPVASDDEIEWLRAALEFYADTSKYPAPLTGGMGALWADCGEIARAALNPSEPRT